MRHSVVSWPVRAAVLAFAIVTLHAQPPTFKSGVDVIRIDVTAVDDAGNPVADLTADEFEVKVDGQVRPVISLRFTDVKPTSASAMPPAYSSNDASISGRLFVLAFDEDSLDPGAIRPVVKTLDAQIRRLGPPDRVALVAVPPPGVNVHFTNDADLLWAGLSRLHGWPDSGPTPLTRAFSAPMVVRSSPDRGRGIGMDERNEGLDRTRTAEITAGGPTFNGYDRAQRVLAALEDLAHGLKDVDGPKTLIIFSSRLPYAHDLLYRYKGFAQKAADARLNVYVLRTEMSRGAATDNSELVDITFSGMTGGDALAGLTGGAVFQAVAGATGVIDRIVRETSGSYVLGVDPPAGAAKDKAARLEVRVRRTGVTVRGRTVVPLATRPTSVDSRKTIRDTLRQPRAASEIPMRVAASNRRDASGTLTTVVTADLELGPSTGGPIAVGYEVVSGERIVADSFQPALPPNATTRGATTTFTIGLGVPAGTYRLRIAAVDGVGRRARVDHPLVVGLPSLGRLTLSDLLVGDMTTGRLAVRNVVSAATGLSAAIEIYGEPETLAALDVEFALSGEDEATRLVRRVVATETADANRRVGEVALPIDGLPAGRYRIAATVIAAGQPLGRTSRTVEVVTSTALRSTP